MNFNSATPTVIAEIGVNHEGSRELCYELIDQAIRFGFDAIKLQHIIPDKIWHPNYNLPILSAKETLTNDLLQKIVEYAKEKQIAIGCTPTFQGSAEIINDVGCNFIKIASPQSKYDYFILDEALETSLPLIVSNGYCDFHTSVQLINYLAKNSKTRDIAFLFCVSAYPADSVIMEYGEINELMNICKEKAIAFGLSDHNQSLYGALKFKYEYQASIFEKHFALKDTISMDKEVSIHTSQAAEYVRQLHMPISNNRANRDDLLLDKSSIFASAFYLDVDVKKGNFFSLKDCKRLRDGDKSEINTYESHSFLVDNKGLKYNSDLSAGHRLTKANLE